MILSLCLLTVFYLVIPKIYIFNLSQHNYQSLDYVFSLNINRETSFKFYLHGGKKKVRRESPNLGQQSEENKN